MDATAFIEHTGLIGYHYFKEDDTLLEFRNIYGS
jgi:hypothetical protein